uniref:BTB domain-containing protein n=1 Tax=Daphnia galeata TaxID=27404 RepID=A0A8J2RWR0_9CRUS|nr:unnamed protein product [Daphnia galeata]
MPITFKDVDVTRIEWTTQLENTNGKESETFQLGRLFTCNPYFQVSCAYSFIDDAVRYRSVEMRFTLVEQSLINGKLHSSEYTGSISSAHHPRPCSIWVCLNGKSISFVESNRFGEWDTEKFIVDADNFKMELNQPLQLTCLFYIEFKTFGLREVNAIKNLTKLFVEQTNCDVQFCFEDNQQIGGHVYVIASQSHVFATAFQNEMQKMGRLMIKDIQPNVFKELLHYIYSSKTSNPLTEDMAKPLLLAATAYIILDLKKECVEFLLKSINVKNAISLMIWAHLNSVEDIEEVALSYAARHGRKIVFQEDFERLMRNYPELCLVTIRRMVDIIHPLSQNNDS